VTDEGAVEDTAVVALGGDQVAARVVALVLAVACAVEVGALVLDGAVLKEGDERAVIAAGGVLAAGGVDAWRAEIFLMGSGWAVELHR
jgi:hypothetical protein